MIFEGYAIVLNKETLIGDDKRGLIDVIEAMISVLKSQR
jgi:hypothetical protein